MNLDGIKKRLIKKTNRYLHGPEWLLADEISKAYGEQKKFAMYLGTIRRIGVKKARWVFNEVRESKARNPRSLFFYLSGKESPHGKLREEQS